jgi:O-antigen/teichoic acid export membrane protein
VSGTPKGYFRLEGRFGLLAFNQICTGLLQLVSSIVLWLLDAPFETYLVVFGTGAVLTRPVAVYPHADQLRQRGIRIVRPWGAPSRRRYFKTVLRMTGGNSILSTLTTSRHQISLFVISVLAGTAATGLFAAASRCANAMNRALVPISQVIFPEILRLHVDRSVLEVRRTMNRITLVIAICALGIVAASALVGPWVVNLVVGREFADAAPIFTVLLAAEVTLWASFHFNPFLLNTVGQTPLLRLGLAIFLAILACQSRTRQPLWRKWAVPRQCCWRSAILCQPVRPFAPRTEPISQSGYV